MLAVLAAMGLHRLRICLRVADQAGRILTAAALPLLVLLLWMPAGVAARLALWSAGLVIAFRVAVCAVLRTAHRGGLLGEPALVVGAGTFGAHIGELMRAHPELGLRVQGYLDYGPPRRDLALPSLGAPADLAQVVARLGIRRVIVCYAACKDEDLVAVLRAARPLRADVCVVPRLYEVGMAVPRACLDEIWGIPLIPLRRLGRSIVGLALKRTFDVVIAATLLITAAPVLFVLAAAIRLQTGQTAALPAGTGSPAAAGPRRSSSCARSAAAPTPTPPGESPGIRAAPWAAGCGSRTWTSCRSWWNVLRGDMSLVGPQARAALLRRSVRPRDPAVQRPDPDARPG